MLVCTSSGLEVIAGVARWHCLVTLVQCSRGNPAPSTRAGQPRDDVSRAGEVLTITVKAGLGLGGQSDAWSVLLFAVIKGHTKEGLRLIDLAAGLQQRPR